MHGLSSSDTGIGFLTAAQRLRGRHRHRRGRRSPFYYWLILLGSAGFVRATSVTPPSFPQLVSEAQIIAQGTVTAVSSRWINGSQGRIIETFVDFAVEKRLKGHPADTLTLQFLGGTVGTDTLRVSGMPEFKVGETEIVFVQNNGVQLCPLVRFMHGRYRVRADAASHRRYIARDDNTPLTSTADVQVPVDEHAANAAPSSATTLSPDDFETQITAEIARQGNASHGIR